MTPTHLLQASFLDVLFENRNKQYGAYVLRKQYNLRLATALALGVSLFVLAGYFISGVASKTTRKPFPPPIDDVFVRTQSIPPPAPAPPKPAPATPAVKAAALPAAQKQFTQIRIMPNPTSVTDVPAQTDLSQHRIASVTTGGPTETVPVQNSPAAEAPPEAKANAAAVPAYAAPQFPGGEAALVQFLSRNLQAPTELEPGEKRTVFVKFFVDVDGAVTGFEVVRSGGAAFDREVVRVLRKMPRWKPALRLGQPVAVAFTQPVSFVSMGE